MDVLDNIVCTCHSVVQNQMLKIIRDLRALVLKFVKFHKLNSLQIHLEESISGELFAVLKLHYFVADCSNDRQTL